MMCNKIFLFFTAINVGLLTSVGATYKNFQPYIGVTGGLEQLSSKRDESFKEDDAAGDFLTTVFSNNKKMSKKSINLSLLTGFTYKPFDIPFVIGPEISWGRGATSSEFKDSSFENVGDTFRFYKSTLARKQNLSIAARFGYIFSDFLVSCAIGYDRGNFKLTRVLTYDPQALPTAQFGKSKALSGLLLGVGIERKFGSIGLGLDFRYTRYSRFNSNINVPVQAVVDPAILRFSARPKIYTTALRVSYHF